MVRYLYLFDAFIEYAFITTDNGSYTLVIFFFLLEVEHISVGDATDTNKKTFKGEKKT